MSTFVGRTREVEHLLSRLDRTLSGRGGVVFITGEAGAGKSTLTERFLVEAALKAPEAHILVGTCSEQYGAGEPYQPFIEAFRALMTEGKRQGKTRGRFHELARSLAPAWIQVVPVAGDVLAAAIETAVEVQRFRSGEAATEAPSEEALFFQYTELMRAAAEEAPVILFLDDLHWADRASVSLFAHLARRMEDQRVLILGTYRPADVAVAKHPILEARAELKRYGVAEELVLEPLDDAALADFIRAELGGPGTPKLRTWLAKRAGTNPLFFGELLRWLVEQGYCVEREGEWGLAAIPDQIEIPASAEGVIEKRLGRLDEEVRRILEYASVQGDEFDSTILARLLEVDDLELEETLERLARVDRLIKLTDTRNLPDGDISSVYLFSHSLIQDVLHRNLQGKRRILLHRKIAGILEELYAGDTSSVDHMLAIHFEEGRQPDRAYHAAVRAAERASRIYAHEDAVELLGRALRNAPGDAERATALRLRAAEWQRAGKFDEALADIAEALPLAAAENDPRLVLSLRHQRLDLEFERGSRPAAELVGTLADLAMEARELEQLAELCEILWSVRTLPQAVAERAGLPVNEVLEEALEVAEALDEPELVARGHYCLGTGPARDLDPPTARRHLEEARERYEAMSNRLRAGHCSNALGVVAVLLGDYERARAELERAEQAFEEVGDPARLASTRNNLGVLLTRTGEFEEAEARMTSARATIRRLGAETRELGMLQGLAELHVATGDLDRAAEFWSALATSAARVGHPDPAIVASCGLGLVHLERGDVEEAERRLADAQAQLEASPVPWTEGRESMLRLRTALSLAAARYEEAEAAAAEAETALQGRDEYLWASFRVLRGEAIAGAGPDRAGEAVGLVEEALETFRKIGAAPAAGRAEALLERLGEAR